MIRQWCWSRCSICAKLWFKVTGLNHVLCKYKHECEILCIVAFGKLLRFQMQPFGQNLWACSHLTSLVKKTTMVHLLRSCGSFDKIVNQSLHDFVSPMVPEIKNVRIFTRIVYFHSKRQEFKQIMPSFLRIVVTSVILGCKYYIYWLKFGFKLLLCNQQVFWTGNDTEI